MRTLHFSIPLLALTMWSCTVKDIDTPALAGPSTLAHSIMLVADRSALTQNGSDFTDIRITATGPTGQSENIALRAQVFVEGVAQDYGTLSTKNPITPTTIRYTAPAASPMAGGQVSQTISIRVTPVLNGDFRAEVPREIELLLIPQGVILPTNPNLIASFDVTPLPAKVLDVLTFDASKTVNTGAGAACPAGCSYAWAFGDGTTSAGLITTHQYRAVGTYQATLTVTDARGAQAIKTTAVTVASGTPPTVLPFTISPTPAPVNVDVFFNASASRAAPGRNIVSYNWNFGDGASGTGVTTTHRYRGVGSYVVTLTVTDDAQAMAQLTQNLSVGLPSSQATAALTATPTTGKPGQRVVLDASASTPSTGATIVSYKFDYGDNSPPETSGNPVQSHVYATAGTFVASVEVTDSNGKTSTKTATVTIAP